MSIVFTHFKCILLSALNNVYAVSLCNAVANFKNACQRIITRRHRRDDFVVLSSIFTIFVFGIDFENKKFFALIVELVVISSRWMISLKLRYFVFTVYLSRRYSSWWRQPVCTVAWFFLSFQYFSSSFVPYGFGSFVTVTVLSDERRQRARRELTLFDDFALLRFNTCCPEAASFVYLCRQIVLLFSLLSSVFSCRWRALAGCLLPLLRGRGAAVASAWKERAAMLFPRENAQQQQERVDD